MKIRLKTKLQPIHAYPKDTLTLLYNDKEGQQHNLGTQPIGREIVMDEAVIFDVDNEFGFEQGIGGIIGKSGKK